jgi:hypothetical protein
MQVIKQTGYFLESLRSGYFECRIFDLGLLEDFECRIFDFGFGLPLRL